MLEAWDLYVSGVCAGLLVYELCGGPDEGWCLVVGGVEASSGKVLMDSRCLII
jgi:hypothetical protein